MEYRDILLVLHIIGVGTWVGANVVQAVAPPLAAAQGPSMVSGWYRIAARLNRVYLPAAGLILITGILMVMEVAAYEFETPFVVVGFMMIAIGAALGVVVFQPTSEEAASAIDSGDQKAARSAAGRLTLFGVLDTLLLVVTIISMVIKLGV